MVCGLSPRLRELRIWADFAEYQSFFPAFLRGSLFVLRKEISRYSFT